MWGLFWEKKHTMDMYDWSELITDRFYSTLWGVCRVYKESNFRTF